MRRSRSIKRSGPYHVESYSQTGCGFVYMIVYPAYPDYGEDWPIKRRDGDGGGPGIFAALGLAKDIEEFLNSPYGQESINKWKAMKPTRFTPKEQRAADKRWKRIMDRKPEGDS